MTSNAVPARAFRFSREITKKFEDYFKDNEHPPPSQIQQWAEEFKVQPKSIQNWFQRHRTRPSKTQGKPTLLQFPPIGAKELQMEEEAAKAAFSYVKDEILIRLVKVLNKCDLTQNTVGWLAGQIGVSESIVNEFIKWRAERRSSIQSTNLTSITVDYEMHPPTELSSPSATDSSHVSPLFARMDLEEESKAAVASLPTPQTSLSPTSTADPEPEVTVPAFYSVWQRMKTKNHPLQLQDQVPKSRVLASLLSSTPIIALGPTH
ncbi:hypothetical protein FRC14_006133 [Serendipita sp. 396]|nr:hypothetical protein FRC14_006133 [Serendipita sp. 396]KAG8796519.1 hypothetical protein FRC16_009661 [Serendipita sp. 398]KAG8852730.1 hypothetical protein FRB91_006087 [Serendipita sp. 411]